MQRTAIEISIPVKIEGAIHFWIERDEWEAMSDEQRKETLDDHVTAAAIRCRYSPRCAPPGPRTSR